MASRGTDLIPVVQKSYDLCAGLYTHVNRFPRAQRGLLGRVILEDALQMLVLMTVANRRAKKGETLAEASGRLDALRITLRLSKRLGFLSNSGYEELSGIVDEVGRMLGGWLKHEARRDDSSAAPAEPTRLASDPQPAVRRRTGGVRYTYSHCWLSDRHRVSRVDLPARAARAPDKSAETRRPSKSGLGDSGSAKMRARR